MSFCHRIFVIFVLLLIFHFIHFAHSAKQSGLSLIEEIIDVKDFKKLVKSKTNVLLVYGNTLRDISEIIQPLKETAANVKGVGTVAIVNCSGEGKKFCKKQKVSPSKVIIKHYQDGEFHKDFERKFTSGAFTHFLLDPKGDEPWEEDESSHDIVHLSDYNALSRLLKKEITKPIMIMFYAPWCGFCKKMKPDYSEAATMLKTDAVLAAMDVNKAENAAIRSQFNITGFPTLIYFQNGKLQHRYEGENNKDAIVNFMRDPSSAAAAPSPPAEDDWSQTESDVVHLTDESFEAFIQAEPSVLVMFYAPWCGHCKKMKPEYIKAASQLKDSEISGKLCALDATQHRETAAKFKIQGYPTVKYFRNGELAFDANVRDAKSIVDFMKYPEEPPPPPPPEKAWHEEETAVIHLTSDTFKTVLKKKKHVLVMFYAPWCGHCKRTKPEFSSAADSFVDDPKVEFAGVDCTEHQAVCQAYNVTGYPTIKYFNYCNKEVKNYQGGRTSQDFVSFMHDPLHPDAGKPPPPPRPEDVWKTVPDSEFLLHATEAGFSKLVSQGRSALVMFYAPWCGHCNAMKADYAKAAKMSKEQTVLADFVTIDATVETALAQKYGISGYPTLKWLSGGKFVSDYDGERTAGSLFSFVKQRALPSGKPSSRDEL